MLFFFCITNQAIRIAHEIEVPQLADELDLEYKNLLRWRHDLHERIAERFPPLADARS